MGWDLAGTAAPRVLTGHDGPVLGGGGQRGRADRGQRRQRPNGAGVGPGRRWRRLRCSARCGAEYSGWWTGDSTGPSTTPSRRCGVRGPVAGRSRTGRRAGGPARHRAPDAGARARVGVDLRRRARTAGLTAERAAVPIRQASQAPRPPIAPASDSPRGRWPRSPIATFSVPRISSEPNLGRSVHGRPRQSAQPSAAPSGARAPWDGRIASRSVTGPRPWRSAHCRRYLKPELGCLRCNRRGSWASARTRYL